jgi:eukaryotic-like serine/threonine-protein kinase
VTAGCLDESTVLAFLGGTLAPEARATVEAHIAACGACADLVTWAAADQASVTRLPGHQGRPFVGGQLQPGARVGRYQILGALGRGGMGEVYAAYHPDLDRRIALKVVHGLRENTGERRARLLREARAIARLSHPNVVTVHDAGNFGDRVFIAMELIDGLTIDQWLRAERRTWQEILDVFIAAGRGLAAAHAAGVVHRDFKPQNVMIAKNGGVRVMDFGLARLALEDVRDVGEAGEDETTAPIGTITKTGAAVGTPAYMSPEQFRREQVDARSDQFSFCVALHEVLFGTRPAAARAQTNTTAAQPETFSSRTTVPAWLRSVVLRGASADRDQRFRSMDELLAKLEQGRTRLRRRVSVVAVGFAALVVSAGAWKIARGNRFVCEIPRERMAAAWAPNDAMDLRRQSIRRAFAASVRATAETSWDRLSKVLDEHMNDWSAMYVQTCEATNIRREQSTAVLDLRISCLNDNLDQVRALTDALVTADGAVVARAVAAAQELTPVSRCADVAVLRSAVPLPRDERTLREVQRLRRELAQIEAMREVGRMQPALRKAAALKSEVERTGYRPLLGQLLQLTGLLQSTLHMREAETTLEEAFLTAETARDDAIAARAAAMLIYVVGVDLGRLADAERWARLATAILDRMPAGTSQTRGWIANNLASVYAVYGKLEQSRVFAERAIALKEAALGEGHRDVAISLSGLASALTDLGRPAEGIPHSDRAISILSKNCDPSDPVLANAHTFKGEALLALGYHDQALASFERAIAGLTKEAEPSIASLAGAFAGLGRAKLAKRDPRAAVALLERANRTYDQFPGAGIVGAETQFALAQSLWDSGADRRRAVRLAESARKTYAEKEQTERAAIIGRWLSSHRRAR